MEETERAEQLRHIAAACTRLLQGSETDLEILASVLPFSQSQDSQVAKSAILSLATVFCDLLPGYRLRTMGANGTTQRVSLGVQKVMGVEHRLLGYLSEYVGVLAGASRTLALPVVRKAAIAAMGLLLQKAHSPEFASQILQVLIRHAADTDREVAALSCAAVSRALQEDVKGSLSQEAVQLVADLVKRCNCRCWARPVTLLQDVKTQFLGSSDPREKFPLRSGKGRGAPAPKKRKVQQIQDVRHIKRHVSAIAEAIFEVYFRVLKHTADTARSHGSIMGEDQALVKHPLVLPVLEGLIKHSQLMGMEYHEDVLKLLLRVAKEPCLPLRFRLMSLFAAATSYQARGDLLTQDRTPLYSCFHDLLPLCSLTPVQHALPVGAAASNVHMPTHLAGVEASQSSLLLHLAKRMLTGVGQSVEVELLATSIRRLLSVALQLEAQAASPLLEAAHLSIRQNRRLRSLLLEGGSSMIRTDTGINSADNAYLVEELRSPLWLLPLAKVHVVSQTAQSGAGLLEEDA